MSRAILFSDTHLFLHYEDPQQVRWSDLIPAAEIVLMVGRTTLKELDKHKFGLRGRAQDRARRFVAALSQIAVSARPFEVRKADPRVLLAITARPQMWVAPPDLNPQWQDDQLIADLLAYQSENAAESVFILTGDPGVLGKARTLKIPLLALPDAWLLPPEATPEHKELEKLRLENAKLKRNGPSIEAVLLSEGTPAQFVSRETWWFPPLSSSEAATLIAEAEARSPQATDFDQVPAGEDPALWDVPTADAVRAFKAEYTKWRAELSDFVNAHCRPPEQRLVKIDLTIELTNSGVEPADDTRLVIDLEGPFTFLHRRKLGTGVAEADGEADKDAVLEDLDASRTPPALARLRNAPTAPRPKRRRPFLPAVMRMQGGQAAPINSLLAGKTSLQRALEALDPPWAKAMRELDSPWARAHLHASQVDPLGIRALNNEIAPLVQQHLMAHAPFEPDDPQEFIWRTPAHQRNGTQRWEFACRTYQHRAPPEAFHLRVAAWVLGVGPLEGTLKVRVTARNLREPYEVSRSLRLVAQQRDGVARVRAALPGAAGAPS